MDNQNKIKLFRKKIEEVYAKSGLSYAGFDEIICYELHSQPVTPRLLVGETGLTFRELAQKWGISISFLGELILDHCKKLEQ